MSDYFSPSTIIYGSFFILPREIFHICSLEMVPKCYHSHSSPKAKKETEEVTTYQIFYLVASPTKLERALCMITVNKVTGEGKRY
jgi:hypothetical protein